MVKGTRIHSTKSLSDMVVQHHLEDLNSTVKCFPECDNGALLSSRDGLATHTNPAPRSFTIISHLRMPQHGLDHIIFE